MPRDTAARIAGFIRERGMNRIAGEEWNALREAFGEISESTLRKHILALDLPFAQPWRGVDTGSLDSLETSLLDLADAYRTHPKLARAVVIGAKDKARFAVRNPGVSAEKRALKLEMVEWTLVWLGDPAMFSDWARLRRRCLSPEAREISPAKPIQP